MADEIFAPHFLLNGVDVEPEGPKRNVLRTRAGFPDVTLTVNNHSADKRKPSRLQSRPLENLPCFIRRF